MTKTKLLLLLLILVFSTISQAQIVPIDNYSVNFFGQVQLKTNTKNQKPKTKNRKPKTENPKPKTENPNLP